MELDEEHDDLGVGKNDRLPLACDAGVLVMIPLVLPLMIHIKTGVVNHFNRILKPLIAICKFLCGITNPTFQKNIVEKSKHNYNKFEITNNMQFK